MDEQEMLDLLYAIRANFCAYERGMIVERTQTGKEIARQNPEFREGRPHKYSQEQIRMALELLAAGKSYKQVQTLTGISKSTLLREKRGQSS